MSTKLIESHAKLISKKELLEAVNEANREANAEILKVLKTKELKVDKVLDILEKYNLKVADHNWSSQGYITIEGPNGRKLCISKDMKSKVGLFNPTGLVVYGDSIDKVDFLEYLTGDPTSNRKYDGRRGYFDDGKNRPTDDTVNATVSKYKWEKERATDAQQSSARRKQQIVSKKAEIDKMLSSLDEYAAEVVKKDAEAAEALMRAKQILTDLKFKRASRLPEEE